ncbi:MAG: hypothetical protein Q7R45_15875, partial [Sulfuricaulis sp.]|nr:hypothetical protein [Sulfuricaulis sp.]
FSGVGQGTPASASAWSTAQIMGFAAESAGAGVHQLQPVPGRVFLTLQAAVSVVANEILYLSTVAGQVTNVPPATAGTVAVRVGYAMAAAGPGGAVDALFMPLSPSPFVDGAVAAPAIAFASDLGTGWYRAAAGTMGLASAGVAAGRIGDGTSFLRMGLAAGGGAGVLAAAGTGTIRMAYDGSVKCRNEDNDRDLTMLSYIEQGAAEDVIVLGENGGKNGGALIKALSNIWLTVNNTARFHVTGTQTTIHNGAAAASLATNGASLYYSAATVAPTFYHVTSVADADTCDNFTIYAQDASGPGGTSFGGNLLLRGGQGLVAAGNKDGNVAFHAVPGATAPDWNAGEKIIFIADAITAPNAVKAGGSFLWSASGVLATNSSLAFGAAPATTGTIRDGNNLTHLAVRATDATNMPFLKSDASNQFYVGSDAGTQGALILGTPAGPVVLKVGALQMVYMITTGFYTSCPIIQFNMAVVAPQIIQITETTAAVNGDDLTIGAQSVSNATVGNAAKAGNLGLRGGIATGDASNLDGNVWFHTVPSGATPYEAGEKICFMGNAVTAPTAAPGSGAYFYALAGVFTMMSSSAIKFAVGASNVSTGDLEPEADNTRNCGQVAKRWANGYFTTVVQGDTAFTDERCPICGEEFAEDDDIILRATRRSKDGPHKVTYTVPRHAWCAARKKAA